MGKRLFNKLPSKFQNLMQDSSFQNIITLLEEIIRYSIINDFLIDGTYVHIIILMLGPMQTTYLYNN